jgi:hypothetical protein
MNRSLKNTAAVLLVTAMTALAVFDGVQLSGLSGATQTTVATSVSAGVTTASSASQSGTRTCPRTGCTASTCHATTGLPPGQ